MTKEKKIKHKFVLRCIKSNKNKFGFGYSHSVGQYVSQSGRGATDINDAFIYGESQAESCPLEDHREWENYYRIVPVKVEVNFLLM